MIEWLWSPRDRIWYGWERGILYRKRTRGSAIIPELTQTYPESTWWMLRSYLDSRSDEDERLDVEEGL